MQQWQTARVFRPGVPVYAPLDKPISGGMDAEKGSKPHKLISVAAEGAMNDTNSIRVASLPVGYGAVKCNAQGRERVSRQGNGRAQKKNDKPVRWINTEGRKEGRKEGRGACGTGMTGKQTHLPGRVEHRQLPLVVKPGGVPHNLDVHVQSVILGGIVGGRESVDDFTDSKFCCIVLPNVDLQLCHRHQRHTCFGQGKRCMH